jgi:hypothetical protein
MAAMAHDFSSGPTVPKADMDVIAAESESFVAFDLWMDQQLEQLVARWIHTAAPNADRAQAIQGRFGRQAR